MSMNQDQELQHRMDGLMLRIAQQSKDITAMQDKRIELEAARALNRAEIERLKNKLAAALAACEVKHSMLQLIYDEEQVWNKGTVAEALAIRPDSKALDEASW